jgi:hypothetical protein
MINKEEQLWRRVCEAQLVCLDHVLADVRLRCLITLSSAHLGELKNVSLGVRQRRRRG